MIKIATIFLMIVFVSCNNNHSIKKENRVVKQPTLLGLWKVKYVNETDFVIDSNDTLRGPFRDTAKNENITFTADSIIYYEGNDSTPKINKYIYHKINDSVLYVLNVGYKDDSMRFYIHQLDSSKLKFTNIRLDNKREERYEVTIECSKN
ncbi:MAG: hypothetical protein JSR09_00955 [Bacteroidetes bacterium]|nr:hypothetical protein [Bacteroidota bacterium]MBS1648248.1 hypothetical protein [Bacteroidota bacterium]